MWKGVLLLSIAIVIPWFGESLKGGAEQHAWQIALRLSERGHQVEVLTTCCASFLDDWSGNQMPSGITHVSGVTIRRFEVRRRNRVTFDAVNRELLSQTKLLRGVSPVGIDKERVWIDENINSDALEKYLRDFSANYSHILFIPYLYGTTIRGIPLAIGRAWLLPCLHDEAYAYLAEVEAAINAAEGLLFLSAGEMQLATKLYGPAVLQKGTVVGAGIELNVNSSSDATHLPNAVRGKRYILSLGRRCVEKGTDLLTQAFETFMRGARRSDLFLVLAGPGEKIYHDEATHIIDLGAVAEDEKLALLKHSLALVQPSPNESFSRALFESWICGRPAIVNRRCLATTCAVEESCGGWIAETTEEWVEHFSLIDQASASDLDVKGNSGKQYALTSADWNSVVGRMEKSLDRECTTTNQHARQLAKASIHQLLPNLSLGDAISDQALWIQRQLEREGHPSRIYVLNAESRMRQYCDAFAPGCIGTNEGLIYHHSIGSKATAVALEHMGPKWFLYHNITPPEFFEPYNVGHARLLREGRDQMWRLADAFPRALGDSQYNCDDLLMYGFQCTTTLPIVVDPEKWNTAVDRAIMRQLQDGRRNLLHVGRYAPNKCQHDLVSAFARYLEFDPNARLILVGSGETQDAYRDHIAETISFHGLKNHVLLTGHVSQSQLCSYYRIADLYWSMSEHEGFCVPIVEAMWFDIPVLAFRAGAIPETLGGAGVLFDDKRDLDGIARVAVALIADERLRRDTLRKQRKRRVDFTSNTVARLLHSAISS